MAGRHGGKSHLHGQALVGDLGPHSSPHPFAPLTTCMTSGKILTLSEVRPSSTSQDCLKDQ